MDFMNNCDVISLTREVIPYIILIMKSLPSKKNVEDGEKLLKMRMKKACVCSPNILFSCTCWLSHHHRHSSMWVCDVIWASELFKFLSHLISITYIVGLYAWRLPKNCFVCRNNHFYPEYIKAIMSIRWDITKRKQIVWGRW